MKNSIVCSAKPNIVWISEKLIEDRFDANPFKAEYIEDEIKETKFYKCKSIQDILRNNRDLTGGATPLGANYIESGIRFIRTQDVDFNWIDVDNTVFISEDDDKKLRRSSLEVDDILLTITGVNFGKSAPVRKVCLPANISQHSVRLHFKEGLDPHYISTFLNCLYGQKQIFKRKVGATRPAIDYSGIRTIKIPIPSHEIQKQIGDKVRKSEELREEAKGLAKEAEEIFNKNYQQVSKKDEKHEWVKGYYLSEDNVIPNFYKQYDLLKHKNFVYLEFENIVDSIKSGIPVRSDMRIGSTYPFYGASGITDNIDDYNFDGEYLVIAQDGSVGCANIARGKFWANNHVWVVQIKEEWDIEFLELYLLRYNYWISLTTGSVVPKVTLENLKRLLIPKIDFSIQNDIGKRIRESKNKKQNSKMLIEQAKLDIEDLIEGNFSIKV